MQICIHQNVSSPKRVIAEQPTTFLASEDIGHIVGRFIKSCFQCRRRKTRCDRSHPCQKCSHSGRICVYHDVPERPPKLSPGAGAGEGHLHHPGSTAESRLQQSSTESEVRGAGQLTPRSTYTTGPGLEIRLNADLLDDQDGSDDAGNGGIHIGRLEITEGMGRLIGDQLTRNVRHFFVHSQAFASWRKKLEQESRIFANDDLIAYQLDISETSGGQTMYAGRRIQELRVSTPAPPRS